MASREPKHIRPRSYAEILDGSVRHYRTQFVRLLIPFLPMAAIDVVSALLTTVFQARTMTVAAEEPDLGASFGLLGLVSIFAILRWAANLLGYATDVLLVSSDLEGTPISSRQAWDRAKRDFWMLLGLLIVVSFVVSIGLFALIVPGIYLAVRFCVTAQAVLLERRNVGDALTRSGELVHGHFWRAIALMLVLWVLMTILSLPAAGISVFSMFFVGEEGEVSAGLYALLALGQLAAVLVTAVLSPLVPLVFTHFYWDLRMRREGADPGGPTPVPEQAT